MSYCLIYILWLGAWMVYVWCNVDISIHFFHDSQLGEIFFERYVTCFGILLMLWPNITSIFLHVSIYHHSMNLFLIFCERGKNISPHFSLQWWGQFIALTKKFNENAWACKIDFQKNRARGLRKKCKLCWVKQYSP